MGLDLHRRKIIKAGLAGMVVGTTACVYKKPESKDKEVSEEIYNKSIEKNYLTSQDVSVKDNLEKIKNFNSTFADDIFLKIEQIPIFKSTLNRISRVQKLIGYANFNLLGLDEMLLFAVRYSQIGEFAKQELDFIEDIFSRDVNTYGFYGDKVLSKLSSTINKNETIKIRGTGHYLFNGDAMHKYQELRRDVGDDLILTSGVRSIVKQFHLFLAKLETSNGNLSMASRSLAPPGHSYHGIGDFDVGKRGYGELNFTDKFATTEEYKKLIRLKYVDLRYTKDNQSGVRYEPWHIKVV